jgi:FkbM family methyltransferase
MRIRSRRAEGEREHENIHLLMAFLLAPDSNCVDVGASYGVFLKDIVHLSPKGSHLAFEPIPILFDRLVSTFPEVDARCVALSDESGEASFNWLPDEQGLSGLSEYKYAITATGQQITVRTELLDEQLPPGYEPSLIKVDVEGAEYAVLRGGQRTLARFKPVLVIEYPRRGIPLQGRGREDLYDFLISEIGYRVFDMIGNGPLSRSDFAESAGLNFVFHD